MVLLSGKRCIKMKRKGYSPYKESVINFVSNNPGCCKWDVASYCTRNPLRCPSKQYYIVNTAIKNGWIVARFVGNRYELTIPEDRHNEMQLLQPKYQ